MKKNIFLLVTLFLLTSFGSYSQITTYLWSNGATTSSIDVNPSVTTTYYVTITSDGVDYYDSLVVTVNPNPVISGSSSICVNNTTQLTATGSPAIASPWVSSSPNVATVSNTGLVTGLLPGTTTITYTNADGCTATSDVTVNQGAIPTFTQVGPICSGATLSPLPTTSTNAITGTWSPTTLNNTTTTTYTFIPTAGQCGSTVDMTIAVNALPVATISAAGATTFCNGSNVVLNANSGTGLTYQWRRNNVNITGATSASNTATTAGSYTVIVTNASGCSATSAATVVTVNSNPSVTITAAGPTSICSGSNVVLNATTGTGLTYQWTKGNINIPGATSASYTATISGTHKVVATNASGCSVTSNAIFVSVTASTVPTFTQVAPICAGGTFVLPNTSSNGISGSWTPAVNNNVTTLYTFTPLNGTCVVPTQMTVTVNSAPTAAITASGATSFCTGGSVVLNATTGTGLTYQWRRNNVNISGATSASNTATTAGSYTVIVTNASGCSATSAATVVAVNSNPSVTITAAGPTSICSGSNVVLNATTGTGLTYQWTKGNINIPGATSASYTATISGTHKVVATNASGCSVTSNAIFVSVTASTVPTFTQVAPICSGGTFVLPNTSSNGISGSWTPAVNNLATTNYTFTSNTNQCATTSTMTVVVNSVVTPTFTPISPVCFGTNISLPTTSNNGINGSWTPTFNNTSTTAYTFTPAAGQCATTAFIGVNILPNLITTFDNVSPICSGATLSALPTTSTNGITGTWLPALNNTATTTYTFTPTTGQCATTAPMTIVVNQNPTATITPAGATTFCSGSSVVLNANTGSGVTYQWKNNGTDITGVTSASYTATTAGSYTVTITNASGCSATSTAIVVTVNPSTTATFTQVAPICAGGTFVLPSTSVNGILGSWTPAVNNNVTTLYTFTPLNGTCVVPTQMTVTVNSSPTAAITASGATSFCTGGSVVLIATTGTGLTYQWRRNNVNIAGATSASNTATTAGSYTVIVTNASGCSATSAATVVTVNTAPTATITPAGATTFCTGGSVVLNATTGTGLTYQWRRNNVNIAGATSASNTATTTGSYTVIVTNASGCSVTSAATVVTVNTAPTASITAVGSTTFCQGGSVVLNAATGTGLTYQWRRNNVNIAGATSASNTATTAGSYTVIVTNASGCSATSTATVVTVNNAPTAAITASGTTSLCTGGSVVLSATTGTGLTYQWRRNNVNIAGATSASNTATTAGSYTVIVTNASGCSATSAATVVTVSALPTASLTASGATTFCQGSSVVLNANTGTGLTYQWKNNGTNITGATAATYTATTSGSYTVTVTNAGGCSANSTARVVTVNPLTIPIFPQVAPICSGGTFALSATSTNGMLGSWTPAFNNTTTTTYTFTPLSTTGCATTTQMTIVVNPTPTATITAAGPTTFYIGSSVVLNANTGTGLTYVWRKNGTVISGATTASYTATTSGSYTVIVTRAGGCSKTSTAVVVTVVPAGMVIINSGSTQTVDPAKESSAKVCKGGSVTLVMESEESYSYQWNRDRKPIIGATGSTYEAKEAGKYSVTLSDGNDLFLTSNEVVVSISDCAGLSDEMEKYNISLYPNPTSQISYLTVDASLIGYDYVLYDQTGKIVSSEQLKSERTILDLSELAKGMYFLHINQIGDKATLKVIKE